MNNSILNYIFMGVVAFIISACLMPIVIKIAKHVNAVSIPHSRHIHSKPMPLLGGLAIFISFLLCLIIFNVQSRELSAILFSSIFIVLLGLIDDINPLKSRPKFLIQLMIASIIVFYGDIRLSEMFFSAHLTINYIINVTLSIFWIVSVINALNLIDGLNGLSSGISIIYFISVFVISILTFQVAFSSSLSIIMAGATLGFWVWNFPKAKVFMGDTGSTFLGLIISMMPFLDFKKVTLISLAVPMMLLIVPTLDIIFAIIRRTLSKKKITEADNNHIHHQILRATKDPVKTVLIIYGFSTISAVTAIIYAIGYTTFGVILAILLFVGAIIFVEKSETLSKEISIIQIIKKLVRGKSN